MALTKAELASIVAKIEADEVSSQDLKGIRKKKKTLKRVKAAVLDFVQKIFVLSLPNKSEKWVEPIKRFPTPLLMFHCLCIFIYLHQPN